jgi:hypothetical protein
MKTKDITSRPPGNDNDDLNSMNHVRAGENYNGIDGPGEVKWQYGDQILWESREHESTLAE